LTFVITISLKEKEMSTTSGQREYLYICLGILVILGVWFCHSSKHSATPAPVTQVHVRKENDQKSIFQDEEEQQVKRVSLKRPVRPQANPLGLDPKVAARYKAATGHTASTWQSFAAKNTTTTLEAHK
jgi:hypothetical protein